MALRTGLAGERTLKRTAWLPDSSALNEQSSSNASEQPLIPPELVDRAREELGETEEVREQSLKEFRQTFQERHPQFPLDEYDDRWLLRFLRTKKFDMTESIKLLYNYLKFKQDHPHIMDDFTADELRSFLATSCQVILPGRDRLGRCIMMLKAKNAPKYEDISFKQMMRCGMYICEKVIQDPANQINGMVVLVDLHGFDLAWAITVGLEDKFLAATYMEGFPFRLKGAYVINEPWYMTAIWMAVKPFIRSQKILDRIQLFGHNVDKLCKFFDPSVLPQEFGGIMEEVDPFAYFIEDLETLPKASPGEESGEEAETTDVASKLAEEDLSDDDDVYADAADTFDDDVE